MVLDGFACVCVSVCMWLCLKNPVDSWIDGRWRCSFWKERLGGFGGGLRCVKEVLGRKGRSDSRSLCEACFDVLMCRCRLRSRVKKHGFLNECGKCWGNIWGQRR